MKIRGEEYKLSHILFIAFVFVFFILSIKTEPNKELEVYRQELTEKESWLLSEMSKIALFLNFDESEYDYTNREVWFYSWYYGYDFNEGKLLRLKHSLIERGWTDMTNRMEKHDYTALVTVKSDEIAKNIQILCNDKATILLYMTDMQKDPDYKSTKVRTLIELLYDYSSPCYDLIEEQYENSSDIELNN